MTLVWPNGTNNEPPCSGNYGPRQPIYVGGSWTRPYHVGCDHHSIGVIKSIGAGTVIEAGWGGWAGNQVLIYLGLIDGIKTWVRLCHLAELPIVRAGQEVALGQAVGREGETGQAAGVHLHWEIYRGTVDRGSGTNPGSTVDPRAFVRARLSTAPAGGGSKPLPRKRRKPMTTAVIYTNVPADKDRQGAVMDLANGVFSTFGWFPVSYANDLAEAHGSVSAASVTPGHFEQLKRDALLQATRRAKVLVDIDDKDVAILGEDNTP